MTDSLKDHWQEQAHAYDVFSRRVIPYYDELQSAAAAQLCFSAGNGLSILDAGCGTGTTTRTVKLRFPSARITAMDLTEKMLALARQRMEDLNGIEYVLADFTQDPLNGPFDAVISAMALHHIADGKAKDAFYGRIFDALKAGGMFVNADMILGEDAAQQNFNMARWKEHLRRSYTDEEIEKEWVPRYYATDHPRRLSEETAGLRAAGFAKVDVAWRRDHLAVIVAQKAPV